MPISADIAALAGIGPDSKAAVETEYVPGRGWGNSTKELIDRQAAAEESPRV
jgi:hypothetical protein